jgi:hypothetical protein
MHTKFQFKNLKERDHLTWKIQIDGKIILIWILYNWGKVCSGIMWLGIGTMMSLVSIVMYLKLP